MVCWRKNGFVGKQWLRHLHCCQVTCFRNWANLELHSGFQVWRFQTYGVPWLSSRVTCLRKKKTQISEDLHWRRRRFWLLVVHWSVAQQHQLVHAKYPNYLSFLKAIVKETSTTPLASRARRQALLWVLDYRPAGLKSEAFLGGKRWRGRFTAWSCNVDSGALAQSVLLLRSGSAASQQQRAVAAVDPHTHLSLCCYWRIATTWPSSSRNPWERVGQGWQEDHGWRGR